MQRFMSEQGATVDGLKLAQAFLMTTRGTPILYYGDEFAMKGGGDPDNRRDMPGGWPGDAKNVFIPAGRSADENDVWNYVAKLTSIRKDLEPLRRGRKLDLLDEEQQMAFARMTDKAAVIVVFNNDTKPAAVRFDISMLKMIPSGATLTDRLGRVGDVKTDGGIIKFRCPHARRQYFRSNNLPQHKAMENKPRLSFWQIWNMSFGFMGIQFGFGLQQANMSPIYKYLGAEESNLPYPWLAGPITGLLIQPIIGAMSDRTWNKLGRRRPFFLVGAILSSICLILMPFSSAVWMAAGLLWILDLQHQHMHGTVPRIRR